MDLAGYRPNLNEVAALFGKSSRWISDLRAKGDMPEDGATLADFVAAWGSIAAGKGSAKGKAIDTHKARLAAAKADQAEMDRDALKGELLPRKGIDDAMQGAFARVRAKLIGLPSKAAPMVAGLKTAVAAQEKLTELMHEALRELSATVAHPTAPLRIDAGDSGGGEQLVAGIHAPAEADGEPMGGRASEAKPGGKRRARPVGHQPG